MSVLNVQCHASGEVRCSVVISVVIGLCLIELAVHLNNFTFPLCRPDSPFVMGCWFLPMSAVFFPISSSKGVFSNVRSVFSNAVGVFFNAGIKKY